MACQTGQARWCTRESPVTPGPTRRRSAVAKPSPDAPPVTTATFPRISIGAAPRSGGSTAQEGLPGERTETSGHTPTILDRRRIPWRGQRPSGLRLPIKLFYNKLIYISTSRTTAAQPEMKMPRNAVIVDAVRTPWDAARPAASSRPSTAMACRRCVRPAVWPTRPSSKGSKARKLPPWPRFSVERRDGLEPA